MQIMGMIISFVRFSAGIVMACIISSACSPYSTGLDEIIDPAWKPVKLNPDTSFTFTEGPVFDARANLFFTDGPAGKVFRMTRDKKFVPVLRGAGRPDGMMIDPDGNLVVCDYDAKKLDLYSPDGVLIRTLADSYNGKGLNGPNDVVVDRAGGIYFTDPFFLKPGAPQDAEGVYYIPENGEARRICDHLSVPNGIILTPDEKTLLIVDTQEPEIHAIDIRGDGKFDHHRTWGKVTTGTTGQGEKKPRSGSVGVAMDSPGNLYVATDLGLEIFNPKGQSLGILKFDEFRRPMNMTFDRNDPYTLIITAYESVFSLKLKVKGISFPQIE
jgi:gluconolactonase